MTDIEARARELVRGFPTSLAEEYKIRTLLQMHTAALREAREAALKAAMKEAQLYGSERNMDWNDNVLPDENWHKRDAAYAVRDRIEALLETPK